MCVHALDGVDDGKRCITLGTGHGCAYVGSISPHVRVGTCEVVFIIGISHMCGETCSGITCVGVDNARWHDNTKVV